MSRNKYILCKVCSKRISREFEQTREDEKCSICDNILPHRDKVYRMIDRKMRLLDLEFDTFHVSCQVNYDRLKHNEENIHRIVNYKGGNGLKKELRKYLEKQISLRHNKQVDYKNPEVIIQVKIRKKAYPYNPYPEIANVNIFIDSNPLFIEGKYRKLERGIPQTRWPCTHCKGKGCTECDNTGQQYKYTVEDLIGRHLQKLTKGKSIKFHGSGREDIDVLMLGEGRPFVIEVKHPFRRKIDLNFLRRVVNSHSDGKIEINDLKFVDNNRRASIKQSSTESYKVYSAIAEFDKGVTSNDIQRIRQMRHIRQRTPLRVSHRRADLVREREIYHLEAERINSKKLRLIIKCQGGLYIKELISGDKNRTTPSITSITGKNARCTLLDVIEVHIPE